LESIYTLLTVALLESSSHTAAQSVPRLCSLSWVLDLMHLRSSPRLANAESHEIQAHGSNLLFFFVLGKTVNKVSTGMHVDTHRRDSIRQVFPASAIHCVEDTKSPGGRSSFFPNMFGCLVGG
jgi:hypothetical protein